MLVRIIAGDPTPRTTELVRAATTQGVPVVIVELWPQADWTPPFVLSPFVVECRAGEGFPIREIADRIVEATEDSRGARVSSSRHRRTPRAQALVKQAVIRSALIGVGGAPVRRVAAAHLARAGAHGSRLAARSSAEPSWRDDLHGARRQARRPSWRPDSRFEESRGRRGGSLPDPIAHAAVAAAGYLVLLGEGARARARARSASIATSTTAPNGGSVRTRS